MKKDKELQILKVLYKNLEEFKIPLFPENEQLLELLIDIFELDSYYAGLASSVIAGENILDEKLYDISVIKNNIERILVRDSKDQQIQRQMLDYIKKIEDVDLWLKTI